MSRRALTLRRTDGHRRRRLDRLVAAGLIDSFGLALGWTVFLLHAVAAHGLGTAAAYSAAMLFGIALSAPVAGVAAARLDGRRLLRSTAVAEAALRGGVFALLLLGLPLPVLALVVFATNVVAWTGYAGMRAEIAAESEGRRRTRALTWYAGGIAAIEAAGAAVAALLPVGPDGTVTGPLLVVVILVYVIVLVPTFLVARSSRIGCVVTDA